MEKQVFNWPDGWGGLNAAQEDVFDRQLVLEIGADHAIAALRPRAIGTADGSDDVVFAVNDWQAPYFVCHLAWPAPVGKPVLKRRFQPAPKRTWVPAIVPLDDLADLAGYFG